MNMLFQPYPVDFSPGQRLKIATLFSLFVFLFLFVFKPFGLNTYPGNVFLITVGYGFTCFTIMVITNILLPSIFPSYFDEENWTTVKELFFTALNICFIAIANGFYSALIGIVPMNLQVFLSFLFYTIAIGVFPISIFILIKQNKLKQKFEANSFAINKSLSRKQKINSRLLQSEKQAKQLTISSNNHNEELTVNSTDLLYIQSADNYIEVHYLKNQLLTKTILRSTLKQVELDLLAYPQFFRCHKGFLVNIQKISSFSGNAQGYKLHFLETDVKIPVSRKLNNNMHQIFTA